MLKKGILVAVIYLVALSGIALAEEEAQPCASQAVPSGFECIEGAAGITIFNPDNIRSLFGAEPVKQEDGSLLIKYGSGSRALDFATVLGTIVPEDEKKLRITGGKLIAPNSNLSNISAPVLFIDLSELPSFSIEMGEGSLYRKHEYGIICKEGCSMTAKNIINRNPALCTSVLDVKGDAFITYRSKIAQVRRDPNFNFEENEAYVTKIKNLYAIDILPELNLSITAKVPEYGYFGKLGISTGDKVALQNKPLLKLPDQTSYIPYYLITLSQGRIIPEPATNFAVFVKNAPEEAKYVTISFEGKPAIYLKSGNLIFVSSEAAFDSCSHMAAGNIMKWDNAFFFPRRSCAYVDVASGKVKVKPRAFTDFDDKIYPLVLDINVASWTSMVDLSQFECYGPVPCKINLQKEGLTDRQIIFTAEDIIVSPPDRSLFDFGISFGAFVIALDGQTYERIFCDINNRECRIYRESDINSGGTLWYSERESVRLSPRTQRVRLCTDDSECNSGQTCIEHLCVTKSQCLAVEGANSGGSGSKLDIVVAIEDMDIAQNLFPEYSEGVSDTNAIFQKYGRLVAGIESPNSFHGILTMEPFKSNSRKINFWVVGTEQIPILRGNALNTRDAAKSTRTVCPNADYSIILTQQAIGSFNPADSSEVFVSKEDLISKGYGLAVLHEFGHAFGNLADEYTASSGRFNNGPNCVQKDSAQSEWAELVGGSAARRALSENQGEPWLGCGAYCGRQCSNYVRPSFNSIMRDTTFKYMDVAQKEPIRYNDVSEEILKDKLGQYR